MNNLDGGPAPAARRLTRRRFLKRAAAVALAGSAGLGAYTWRVEPHWVEVVRRDLPIARLPDTLAGRTLVQISDLHIGPVVDEDYITRAIVQACSLGPDVLAITGDVMSHLEANTLDQVARVLGHLKPARLATLAVMGNHDYGEAWADAGLGDRLARRLTDAGVDVLRNEVRDVAGLQVAGLDDLWGPNFRPVPVLARLAPGRPALALCHNPDGADEPGWGGYRGWVLCGHTHGGQVDPPDRRAPPLLPVRNRRYVRGEVELGDGRRLYINRGLGYVRRVRFRARPEITVFRLTLAEGSPEPGQVAVSSR